MLNLYTLSAKNLKLGCQTIFKSKAGPKYSCVNAKSAFKNGRCITDTVAVWLKKRLCYCAITGISVYISYFNFASKKCKNTFLLKEKCCLISSDGV